MSARTKARIVGGILVAVALWPLVHRQLVTRYDVNPWKLYGFAMYCTPHEIAVDLIDRSGAAPRRIEPDVLPPAARESLTRFTVRRRTLGALHPPDSLARDVLAANPGTQRLTVAVTVFELGWLAASIEPRTTLHHFERGALD